jgi:hypothetical protein
MFEKTKHAELLLEYGANPSLLNEDGHTPLHLLPRDAVRSTKLYFKKMFEVLLFICYCYQTADFLRDVCRIIQDAHAKILAASESGHGQGSSKQSQRDL